jgi:hypothetical protein
MWSGIAVACPFEPQVVRWNALSNDVSYRIGVSPNNRALIGWPPPSLSTSGTSPHNAFQKASYPPVFLHVQSESYGENENDDPSIYQPTP